MILRRVARPLLAAIFIQGGIAALRDPKAHAEQAAPVIDRLAGVAPVDEVPPALTLVRVDAGVKIGAGALLALGWMPRLSAAALAASLIPTTVAGHRFWEKHDPAERASQQIHFTKNLGLLGGLLLASADTAGKPSLSRRARRARRRSAATAGMLHRDVTAGLGQASGRASGAASSAGKRMARAGEAASDVASQAAGRVTPALEEARKAGVEARKRVEKRLKKESRQAAKRLDRAKRRASKRFDRESTRATDRSARRLRKASAKAREARARVEAKLA